MVDAGKMTAEQAERSEHRNIILQALGPEQQVVPELTRERLMDRDIMLLCSDGLSNQLTPQEMVAITGKNSDLDSMCDALIKRALDTGAPDNVTVVAGRFSTKSESEAKKKTA
jgi:protein phosphatase